MAKEATSPIPFSEQAGVTELKIPSITKAIEKYEEAKEKRCKASPAEVAAKTDLLEILHKNRDKLPQNEDGEHYYRHYGVDYVLEESLKRKKVSSGDDGVD